MACRHPGGKQTPVYFNRPPVSEVVVAAYFKPALELSTEHVGLYWSRIKSEFPVARQQLPVGTEIPVSADVFPMPRYWFTAADGASLIQVQKNAFMFNWRRQDDLYPTYRAIKPRFDKYYDRFLDFVRTEVQSAEPAIDLCDLTYVNTIQRCGYWQGPQDTNKVIPTVPMLMHGSDRWSAAGFECNFAFHTETTIHLQVAVRSGRTVRDASVPILVFEIKATEQVGSVSKSDADDWFDRAHDVVMNCFLGMTSPDVQAEHWERQQ